MSGRAEWMRKNNAVSADIGKSCSFFWKYLCRRKEHKRAFAEGAGKSGGVYPTVSYAGFFIYSAGSRTHGSCFPLFGV